MFLTTSTAAFMAAVALWFLAATWGFARTIMLATTVKRKRPPLITLFLDDYE